MKTAAPSGADPTATPQGSQGSPPLQAAAASEHVAPELFTSEPRSRPTAEVRREVYARDGGSCAWIGEDGRRCGSTWQLEHDHVQSAALGGGASVEETRLLCKPHNMLHAEQVFGREFMEQFRRNPDVNEPWPTFA